MIDLRSDTVTKPCTEMRQAMADAEVGDDVYGEDPTVNKLQKTIASLLGKEAALFVPSGTMANQIAMRLSSQPGQEVLTPSHAHVRHFEGGAAAALAGVQLVPIGESGQFSPDDILAHCQPSGYGRPRTSLVWVENTHNLAGGTVWEPNLLKKVVAQATNLGLACHLDGARLWHAAKDKTALSSLADGFETISVCLSKGLGAPVGSVLASTNSKITKACALRRQLGGAMRQAGIVAAAGLFALQHNFKKLSETHVAAATLFETSRAIRFGAQAPQTNIVMLPAPKSNAIELCKQLSDAGVLMLPMGNDRIRAVTHLQVTEAQCAEAGKQYALLVE